MIITPPTALSRFYTNPDAAALLVQLMDGTAPGRVIDVGVGCGSLSFAAASHWNSLDLSTVDIDGACISKLSKKLSAATIGRHTHYILDALDEHLPTYITTGDRLFDAAISNPPYAGAHWRPGFARILAEAGLDNVYSAGTSIDRDAVFIAQLLRLTKPGGKIGIIVPNSIITGFRSKLIRQKLLSIYNIKTVVQLPRRSFQRTEAQAYIVIMENRAPDQDDITLMRLEGRLDALPQFKLSKARAEERMDFSFYHRRADGDHDAGTSLLDLGATIVRGTLNSKEARASTRDVFHTTDFPVDGSAEVVLPTAAGVPLDIRPGFVAEPGDILLARIDRNLHRKVAIVGAGRAVITDCVYRVRVAEVARAAVLRALRSDAGADALARAARGVGARLLNKRALEHLRLPLGRR